MKVALTFPPLPVPESWAVIADWAGETEQSGAFSALGAVEGVLCRYLDPITVLTIAAQATSSIDLITSVLVAPLRPNAVLLAKQLATLDRLSGGRLTVGLGVGNRKDEFEASGVSYGRRGRRLDEQLEVLDRIWSGELAGQPGAVGPRPATAGGPPLVFAGMAEQSFRRVAERGAGWIAPPGAAALFRSGSVRTDEAWRAADRSGTPRKLALVYYSLGHDAAAACTAFFDEVFSWAPPVASMLARGTPSGPEALAERLRQLADAGCHEAICVPCTGDLAQIETLASIAKSVA